MTLDPQVRTYLDRLAAAGPPALWEVPVEVSRANMVSLAPALFGPLPPDLAAVATEDLEVPGPAGPLRVRLYRPPAEPPLPAALYFHGGGRVIGDLDTHDGVCRHLAARAACLLVAVDYRRAPEHRFPAAVEDSWAALEWLLEAAPSMGADPARIAVAGDSAGGNLAAVIANRAHDRGLRLRLQVLVYPVTDCDLGRASYVENAEGYGLTAASMRWFWEQYTPGLREATHPEASPLRRPDLGGVAPALVLVCGHDPLRDEGRAYAGRLRESGVQADLVEYPDQIHGFFRMPGVIDRARQALDHTAAALRAALD